MQTSECDIVGAQRPKLRVVAPIELRESEWIVHPFLLGEEAASVKRSLDGSGFDMAPEVPMERVPEYFQSAIKSRDHDSKYFLVVWQVEDQHHSLFD